MAVNYVKFMRGTQTLYNSLVTKDADTLYFVYETAQSETGKLYLGNKLISGSSENPSGNISIDQIQDIVLDENLSDGQILVYDEAEGKWVNQTIAEALNIPVMTGATALLNGEEGFVPAPEAGDEEKFLRGDGTWATVLTEIPAQLEQDVSDLQDAVATLVGDNSGSSVEEIVAAKVAELLIPENASESLDTLQEIANWIQDHPDDAAAMSSDISDLQGRVESLEDLLNNENDGLVDRVEILETAVGTLETTMGTFVPVTDAYDDVGSAIAYLNDRLQWHELSN